ncbi:transposase, partial [Streptomyces sp. NPDC127105]|uniref:transposase n=1 Tax=Streptomyces sp. NPDC127105 TaxID=3345359 RepID=UPI003654E1C8
ATSGCTWQQLPAASFGPSGATAHRRFTEWSKARVWAKLHRLVLDELGARGDLDWSRCAIDSTSCTLPWRNPEAPTTALEERQRKPITVDLILTSSHGNRIYYRTWNDHSWKRALAAAGLIKPVGEKVRHDGNRIRRVRLYAAPRKDIAWLRDPSQPKVPEKSLLALRATQLPSNMQVKDIVRRWADMSTKYKETARGGLAVNVIEC